MDRLQQTFTRLANAKQKALSPYICAGDPNPKITVPLMHALVAAGADILELGIPFSDPMAEGPVIQAAMERALAHKVTSQDVFKMVEEFRKQDQNTPIVLMGYLNPIEFMGYEQFAHQAAKAGVDGTIIVDLPPEEAEPLLLHWKTNNLHPIFLCSPTTTDARMQQIAKVTRGGYLYYVSLKGVTGSGALDVDSVREAYKKRKTQTDLPLLVGFGIKTPQSAAQIATFADGVVVGAGLITQIAKLQDQPERIVAEVPQLIREMRAAMG